MINRAVSARHPSLDALSVDSAAEVISQLRVGKDCGISGHQVAEDRVRRVMEIVFLSTDKHQNFESGLCCETDVLTFKVEHRVKRSSVVDNKNRKQKSLGRCQRGV
mgnify:CR=1 FL=1